MGLFRPVPILSDYLRLGVHFLTYNFATPCYVQYRLIRWAGRKQGRAGETASKLNWKQHVSQAALECAAKMEP
jgi:hypothetical protein